MKAAFSDYLRDTPSVKAILVGTRRTDPHGEHLKHFDPTDKGWPAFVRIHPVIDWHYVDVWTVSCSGLAHHSPADLRSSFVTSTYLIAAFMILDTPHSEALLIPTQTPRLLARLHHNKSHRSPTRMEQKLRRENLNSALRTNWLMIMKNVWEEMIEIENEEILLYKIEMSFAPMECPLNPYTCRLHKHDVYGLSLLETIRNSGNIHMRRQQMNMVKSSLSGIETLFTPTTPGRWVTTGENPLYVLDLLMLLFLAPIKKFG
jgi:hypothetical protein